MKVRILPQCATFDRMILKSTFYSFTSLLLLLTACKKQSPKDKDVLINSTTERSSPIEYAKSFSLEVHDGYTVIQVNRPWPKATKTCSYLVASKEQLAKMTFPADAYDAVITTPVNTLIATSTTHIPALESLDALKALVGFPDTRYISSEPARKLIADGKIRELGSNDNLNPELVLSIAPDVIIGFGINDHTNPYSTFEKANIPVVLNGDWTEETPLGKAEWIKFFGVLLQQEQKADSIFNAIAKEYLATVELAKTREEQPKVLSGALYKDVWYLPAGKSWAAQFIADANADYLFGETEGTGSLSLSLETVIEKGQQADYWIAPSQFTSYQEMQEANNHYLQFKAFSDNKVFTFAATKGATGGLLYYELGPQRPDLVLKDLVHIFHPELLVNYKPYFFTPLQ